METHDPIAAEFLHYNRWANLKLIDACSSLTPEQLDGSVPGSYGSIYDTLVHIIRAEASYYRRLTNTRLVPTFAWEDRPLLTAIRPYAEQVGGALLEATGRMSGAGLIVEEWQGQKLRYQPVALLIQLVNHGVEHRTNITTILAQQGIQAPAIDGWGYMLSHPDRLGS